MSASEVVEPCLYIIDIPPIAERLDRTQGSSERTGGGEELAPSIVNVFYHLGSVAVNDSDNITLQILNVSIFRGGDAVVPFHNDRTILGVLSARETIFVGPVVPDAGYPAEVVVQVFHLAAVAEHDPVHHPPKGVIVRGAEHIAAHAHAGLPAQAVVAEMVNHAVGAISVGVVGNAGDVPRLAGVGMLRLHLLVAQQCGSLCQLAQDVVLQRIHRAQRSDALLQQVFALFRFRIAPGVGGITLRLGAALVRMLL